MALDAAQAIVRLPFIFPHAMAKLQQEGRGGEGGADQQCHQQPTGCRPRDGIGHGKPQE
ncbi:hypothetical protein [Halomonas sp. E19]|uniref:hypothetical protein n=1 Tax=Halomonas sp. E19 TaxID=3397247 RepID=UPI004034F1C8